jgi:hypothetical protein
VETIDPGQERAAILRQPTAALGKVVENRVLTKPGAPAKRHIGEAALKRICEDDTLNVDRRV